MKKIINLIKKHQNLICAFIAVDFILGIIIKEAGFQYWLSDLLDIEPVTGWWNIPMEILMTIVFIYLIILNAERLAKTISNDDNENQNSKSE